MTRTQRDVYVARLDCEHDAAAIERGLRASPGLLELKVYPKAGKVRLVYDADRTSDDQFLKRLEELGFPRRPRIREAPPRLWENTKVVTSLAAGALLLTGWLLSTVGAPTVASLVAYLFAVVVGGYFFAREAIEELLREWQVGIELLMSTAAIAAVVMGHAGEGAMLAFLYSISDAAEGYTEEKTRSAVRALMDLTPKRVVVRRNGREEDVLVEDLAVDDLFLVKPGQSVATDGVVVLGASEVNQAPVTGESVPVRKGPGDVVFAGSINGEGALDVRATRTSGDNTIARIVQMVEEAQERKGRSQRFIERFGARYSPLVLLAGILIAVVPPVAFATSWTTWILRATVFIVAAAPCALVISIPITLVAALGTGARRGVLIKGGVHLEELANIAVVAFDKTGTLTTGEPAVADVRLCDSSGERVPIERVLAVAAGIERRSQHPVARAILRYAVQSGVSPEEVSDVRSITGRGASARIGAETVFIASPSYFEEIGGVTAGAARRDVDELQAEGKTVVAVGTVQRIWAVIAVRDTVRSNARAVVAALRQIGITRVVMLTGDSARTAHAVAREVGVDDVFADLTPEGKSECVRDLSARFGHVAMIGDGVNDAPALAEATVGVAMGAAGTDVALETADVALMADDLEKLVEALALARRTQSVVRQNLALSGLVITVLVVGAVAGAFSLPVAVLGHEISEFVVIASGLRLLRWRQTDRVAA